MPEWPGHLPRNRFKQALAAGERQVGLWSALASPIAAEILGGAGFDWIVIDGEHGPNDITTLTWFFLTWFPLYLAQARHMSVLKVGFAAAVPGLCGGIGGILGGVISDDLLRRGCSLSFARKLPIMTGMALSMVIIACNYSASQTIMLLFMSISFFGKGIGALGWTVISDTSPKGMVGMNGALFNLCGNLAGVTTPLIIGYIVEKTHSYNGALIFVALIAFCAIVSYGPIVGEIKRLELTPVSASAPR